MTSENKEIFARIEVDATLEELNEEEINRHIIEDKVPKFVVPRKQKSFLDKTKTPLWKLEEAFINEQEARRNSPYTIKHYQQTFRVFYEFLAYTYCEDSTDIDRMYENAPASEKNPLAYYGKMLPIALLENDDLQRDFGEYLTDVREVSEKTVETYFRDYRAFMYYAMQNRIITPFAITVQEKEAPIKQVYTDTEIKKLLKKPNTDDFEEVRNWVIINYFLDTGNRLQTVINLKVKDIDFDDNFININTQKSGKTARIGLTKKLGRILQQYIYDYRCNNKSGEPLEDEYLFCTKYGEKFTDGMFKQTIKSYNLSRGVNKTSIHLFRHTYAKLWITSGGDLISLQKTLGHSSLRMVQHYSNLYATDVRDKMEQHSVLNQQRVTSGEKIKKRQPIEKRK